MKRLNTFAKLSLATTMAFGSIAPIATMITPIHAAEEEVQPAGMIDTHNIENMNIQCVGQLVYNGGPQEQQIKFMINNEEQKLTKDVDYTVDGNIATEAGTYTMTIKGINDFHGEAKVSFTIEQGEQPVTPIDGMWDTHNIENLNVRLANQLVADGTNQTQKITISCEKENVVLEEGVDYVLSNNVASEAGNYTLTAQGINNYHGTIQVSFTIEQGEQPVTPIDGMWDTHNIENLKVRLANQLVANGTNQAQKIVITCDKENLVLEEGVDYVLSNNVAANAGNYTLTAKGINNYHGTIQVNYTVLQGEKKNDKKDAKKQEVHTGVHTGMLVAIGGMMAAALGAIACVFANRSRKAK